MTLSKSRLDRLRRLADDVTGGYSTPLDMQRSMAADLWNENAASLIGEIDRLRALVSQATTTPSAPQGAGQHLNPSLPGGPSDDE